MNTIALSLADLNLIARSLPPFSSNGLGGDAKVEAFVYRGHAWIEVAGAPVGIEDEGAAELAQQADTTVADLEAARVTSAGNDALRGHEAIAYATRFGLDLTKCSDPTEEARVVDADEAREIAKEDASILEIEAPAFDATRMTATHAAVGNDGRRPCVWGLGTSAEMAYADALRQDGLKASDGVFLRIEEVGPEVQERVQHGDVTWSNA